MSKPSFSILINTLRDIRVLMRPTKLQSIPKRTVIHGSNCPAVTILKGKSYKNLLTGTLTLFYKMPMRTITKTDLIYFIKHNEKSICMTGKHTMFQHLRYLNLKLRILLEKHRKKGKLLFIFYLWAEVEAGRGCKPHKFPYCLH